MSARLLIVDDDSAIRDVLNNTFLDQDFEVFMAEDGDSGLDLLREHRPNVAIIDINLPGKSGFEILKESKQIDSRIAVIIATGNSTTQNAIEAMKFGAFDYITKPFDLLHVRAVVGKALDSNLLSRKVNFSRKGSELPDRPIDEDMMIGSSTQMLEIWKKVGKVATSDETVLIEGDSGTGKELLARAIYSNSLRKHRAFMAVNCAAMPENLLESELFGHEKGAFTDAQTRRVGKFEQCNGGTLFLDEISEMSMANQSKFLRVLENQSFHRLGGNEEIKVDVRIIAAANRNLQDAVIKEKFRLDLFYRLRVVGFQLPRLCERPGDIPELIELFIKQNAIKSGRKNLRVTPGTVNFLSSLPWKGNIRELKNAISSAVVFSTGEVLQPDDFVELKQGNNQQVPADKSRLTDLGGYVREVFPELCRTRPGQIFQELCLELESSLVDMAMEHCDNNQVAAAKLLGISRNTLRKRLEREVDTAKIMADNLQL